MKKLLSLLLAFLLLFAVGCQKEPEDEAPKEPNKGVLYEADGLTQNTLVTLQIVERTMVNGATGYSGYVFNHTDYQVKLLDYPYALKAYKLEEGNWTAPKDGFAYAEDGKAYLPETFPPYYEREPNEDSWYWPRVVFGHGGGGVYRIALRACLMKNQIQNFMDAEFSFQKV